MASAALAPILKKMFSISWLMILRARSGYRDLTPADEASLLSRHMNRVTTPASRRWRPCGALKTRC